MTPVHPDFAVSISSVLLLKVRQVSQKARWWQIVRRWDAHVARTVFTYRLTDQYPDAVIRWEK